MFDHSGSVARRAPHHGRCARSAKPFPSQSAKNTVAAILPFGARITAPEQGSCMRGVLRTASIHRKARRRERVSSRGRLLLQYIGPPTDAECFVDALHDESLTAEYAPLLSTLRRERIFEVGLLEATGPDLYDRSLKAI